MRLIDTDKLLDNLSGMLKRMDDYDAVRKVINDMPTAYDVDKVVEQLEDDKRHTFDGCVNKKYAINVVKAGGIDVNN